MSSGSRVELLFDVFKLWSWIVEMDACIRAWYHRAVCPEIGVVVLGEKGLKLEFPIWLSAGSFALELCMDRN